MLNTHSHKNLHWSLNYFVGFSALLSIAALISYIFRDMFLIQNVDAISAAQCSQQFWKDIFSGQLPGIEWANGEWIYPMQSMLYNGISEPWNILYAFVGEHSVLTMFCVIIMLKLALAGFTFGIYIKRYSVCNRIRSIAALGYAIVLMFMAIWNPMTVLNAGYLMPLLLHATDKALRQKQYAQFALTVSLAYFVNFYLAIVLSIVCLVYGFIHFIRRVGSETSNAKIISHIIFAYLIGAFSASVVFLPALLGNQSPSIMAIVTGIIICGCLSAMLIATHGWFKESVKYKSVATAIAAMLTLSLLICGPLFLTENKVTDDGLHFFLSQSELDDFVNNPDEYKTKALALKSSAAYTLAGVEYIAIPTNDAFDVPYGFVLYKTIENEDTMNASEPRYYIYKNTYHVGMGYMYDTLLPKSDFTKLDVASQQLALMKYAVVDDDTIYTVPQISALELPATITKTNEDLYISLNIPAGYEAYLSIKNAGVKQDIKYTVKTQDGIVCTQNTTITPNNSSILIGYGLSGDVMITLHNSTFNQDDCTINAYSLSEYITKVQQSKKCTWETNKTILDGHLSTNTNGIFQLAVPYSSGWTAYVNHQPADVIKVGEGYIGIKLSKGEYDIRFEYITPGLGVGTVFSMACIASIIIWLVIEYQEKFKLLLMSSKHGSLFRFVITGCCTTTTDFLLYHILTTIGLFIPLSKGFASICAACLSFFMNRKWSFRATAEQPHKQIWKFICSQAISIGANVCTNSLVLLMFNHKILAFLCATFVSMCINYTLQKVWVFCTSSQKS